MAVHTTNLFDLLSRQSEATPSRPALITGHGRTGRIWTYAEIEDAAIAASKRLIDCGLQAGDQVLLLYPMSAELYIYLLACLRLELVAVFIDPSQPLSKMRSCWQQVDIKAVSFKGLGPIRLGARDHHSMKVELNGETPALITFTSGSTGQPKCICRSQEFLLAQHRALTQALGLQAGLVQLTALPIFVLANLAAGMTTVIPDGNLRKPAAVNPDPILAQIEQFNPDQAVASPAFFDRLTQSPQASSILGSLKTIYTGGAPVTAKLLRNLRRHAPTTSINAVYGSTECEPIAHFEYNEDSSTGSKSAAGSGGGLLAGQVQGGVSVRIIGDRSGQKLARMSKQQFESMHMREGEIGEIVVSAEHVVKSYLNAVGDHETKIDVDGERWHRTGDAGYFDESGKLWLLGRCSAKIADRNGVLYPFSIEARVEDVPGIRRAAVLSVAGKRVLIVESEHPFREPDLTTVMDCLVLGRIDRVELVTKIPVDTRHNSKIDYPALIRQTMRA